MTWLIVDMVVDGALDLSATFVTYVDHRNDGFQAHNPAVVASLPLTVGHLSKVNNKGGAQVQGAVKDHARVDVNDRVNL